MGMGGFDERWCKIVEIKAKYDWKDLLRGSAGEIIFYVLFALNPIILEWLINTGWSVTVIAFVIGFYNISAKVFGAFIDQTLGSLPKELLRRAEERAKQVGENASSLPDVTEEVRENISIKKEEYEKTGEVITDKRVEEIKEEREEQAKMDDLRAKIALENQATQPAPVVAEEPIPAPTPEPEPTPEPIPEVVQAIPEPTPET